MIKKTYSFLTRLDDKIRARLRRYPIVYTFVGGVALILFWRGVWHTADLIPFLTGPISILLSLIVLLITGLFVSFFITDQTILSGITQEKKLAQKTETEVREEAVVLQDIKHMVDDIKEELDHIEHSLEEKK